MQTKNKINKNKIKQKGNLPIFFKKKLWMVGSQEWPVGGGGESGRWRERGKI